MTHRSFSFFVLFVYTAMDSQFNTGFPRSRLNFFSGSEGIN